MSADESERCGTVLAQRMAVSCRIRTGSPPNSSQSTLVHMFLFPAFKFALKRGLKRLEPVKAVIRQREPRSFFGEKDVLFGSRKGYRTPVNGPRCDAQSLWLEMVLHRHARTTALAESSFRNCTELQGFWRSIPCQRCPLHRCPRQIGCACYLLALAAMAVGHGGGHFRAAVLE